MLYATHNVNIGAKIQGQLISNLRFADDIVILAESANGLQNLVDKVYENSSNLGLKINITKTEVQVIGKQENHINNSKQGCKLAWGKKPEMPEKVCESGLKASKMG